LKENANSGKNTALDQGNLPEKCLTRGTRGLKKRLLPVKRAQLAPVNIKGRTAQSKAFAHYWKMWLLLAPRRVTFIHKRGLTPRTY